MNISEVLNHDSQFRYMLLSRMMSDCEYYLGNGNHHSKHLWALNEDKHIGYMVEIWNSFPEQDKPEWLTFEEIKGYAMEMGVDFEEVINHIKSEKAAKALQEFADMSLQSENSIDTEVVLNLCNYYDMDTVINLLSDNQKNMLQNAVEMAIDYGVSVDKSLFNIYNSIINASEKTKQNEKTSIRNKLEKIKTNDNRERTEKITAREQIDIVADFIAE